MRRVLAGAVVLAVGVVSGCTSSHAPKAKATSISTPGANASGSAALAASDHETCVVEGTAGGSVLAAANGPSPTTLANALHLSLATPMFLVIIAGASAYQRAVAQFGASGAVAAVNQAVGLQCSADSDPILDQTRWAALTALATGANRSDLTHVHVWAPADATSTPPVAGGASAGVVPSTGASPTAGPSPAPRSGGATGSSAFQSGFDLGGADWTDLLPSSSNPNSAAGQSDTAQLCASYYAKLRASQTLPSDKASWVSGCVAGVIAKFEEPG